MTSFGECALVQDHKGEKSFISIDMEIRQIF